MWRAAVKSLRARKLRLVLTAMAVVLGIAFVAGTLVLTDTALAAFDDLFGGQPLLMQRHNLVDGHSRPVYTQISAANIWCANQCHIEDGGH